MEINYKKFKTFSHTTQEEIVAFAQMLLSAIELHSQNDKNEVTLQDFQEGNFNFPKLAGAYHGLNSVVEGINIEIPRPFVSGRGPTNNRRLTTDLVIKYTPGTAIALTSFLELTVQVIASDPMLTFLLSKDAQLTRQVPIRGDKSYALMKNSRRHKVLKALIGCKSGGYCHTSDLAETAECSEEDFRKTSGELKKKITEHFSGVRMNDVIVAKSRSGYRLKEGARIVIIP
jgi:hypothetical protein